MKKESMYESIVNENKVVESFYYENCMKNGEG